MRFAAITFILVASIATIQAQRRAGLELLAFALEGSYSNAEQAKADTNFREVELEMKRIWGKRKDGAWFYVEQAAAKSKTLPDRQRVYQVRQVNDSTFTCDIHRIKRGEALLGAYADPVKLDALHADSLELLQGCTITLYGRGNIYVGGTNGRNCTDGCGAATYVTSELSLFPDRAIIWDRGYNAVGNQVCGAENGGYFFIKRPKY